MLAEQRLEVAGALGDPRRRHADVFDDQRRARNAQLADEAVKALADPPVDLDRLGITGEVGGPSFSRPSSSSRARASWAASASSSSPPNSISSAADAGSSSFQASGAPWMLWAATISAGATINSTAVAPLATSSDTGSVAAAIEGKWTHESVVIGGNGTVSKRRLGDERQRPLRSDQQPPEDLHRGVGVEERAQPIAGGVLDLELASDPCRELVVGEDLGADVEQAAGELGLGGGELSSASGSAVSMSVPEGSTKRSALTVEYESAVTPQRIPPELLAITPPTVAKSTLAGSGPSRRPYGARIRFAWPTIVPGRTLTRAPSSSASAPEKWRRTSTRMPSVCDWPFRLVRAERKVSGISAARTRTGSRRRRRRAGAPPPAGSTGRDSRRRRSGPGPRPVRAPGGPPSRAASLLRSGSAVPVASSSGIRSAAGSAAPGATLRIRRQRP